MYLDAHTLLSDEQALTASAPSDNILDFGADRDVGPGAPVNLLVQVSAAFDNLTTLTVKVQTDDDPAFGTPTTLAQTYLSLADLTQGARFPLAVLPHGTQRYLRLDYTVTGTAPTQGALTAGLVVDRETAR